ncbi:MAG: SMUG2 DNA glycosylase family protein [Bacteroidetes bacterium]|nr:MAG: SMUG2 DNA glycosylase family protein [Bacteroidota bacterium]
MNHFADRVIEFNQSLKLDAELPAGIRVMNPFRENPEAVRVSSAFYHKFYNDNDQRRLILAINPGRFGAGVTGIPFTDTKRLTENCGLHINDVSTHEPSSVFVYQVIEAYGGVEKFYRDFYINSICPLGFVRENSKGREVNYNYYDSKELQEIVLPFAVKSIRAYIDAGCKTDVCFCMGTGKNYKVLQQINREHAFFDRIIPLEHPRYVVQYKSAFTNDYISKYLKAFGR